MLALTGFAFALLSAGAIAASPSSHQYGSSLEQIGAGGGGGGTGGGTETSSSAVGGLPFTGLDLALLVVVAAALVLAGLLLRRRRAGSSEA